MIKVIWLDGSVEYFKLSDLSDSDYETLLLYSSWKEIHIFNI